MTGQITCTNILEWIEGEEEMLYVYEVDVAESSCNDMLCVM